MSIVSQAVQILSIIYTQVKRHTLIVIDKRLRYPKFSDDFQRAFPGSSDYPSCLLQQKLTRGTEASAIHALGWRTTWQSSSRGGHQQDKQQDGSSQELPCHADIEAHLSLSRCLPES